MTSPLTSISALIASALCVLTMVAATAEPPATITSTPMEAALDALRSRFPNQVVIGFEELWDVRPQREPQIDLGPANSTLQQVLDRIRRENPKYKIELLQGSLVHVHPAHDTADLAGLLDPRLPEFFLPQDDCVAQQLLNMDRCAAFSYTPELSRYLCENQMAWYRAHGRPFGVIGDFLGDCEPAHHRHEPIYHDITVREALNLMAIRSLQVATGSYQPTLQYGQSPTTYRGSTASAVILTQTPASEESLSSRPSSNSRSAGRPIASNLPLVKSLIQNRWTSRTLCNGCYLCVSLHSLEGMLCACKRQVIHRAQS